MFRRLRIKLLGNRRYRDAAFARPSMSRRTEATMSERFVRALRRPESFAYDEREQRLGGFLRLVLVWGVSLGALLFLGRSILALDIFSGN